MALCTLTLLAGCSIDFDRFLRGRGDGGAALDAGSTDLGVSPRDTGTGRDTGVVTPTDTGTGRDTGVVTPTDTGVVTPTDTGVVGPGPCRAPYVVAVAENLYNDTSRLLRWSFADGRRCDDLPLDIAHPRAVGVAFTTASDLGGPQLIVVNEAAVSAVDAQTGAVIRDVASSGPPRSVFDLVSNSQGTFAVAYGNTGSASALSVGEVRVFDHRNNNLVAVQRWQSNMQFSLSVMAMTAFPGNQGQYLTLRPAETGGGASAFVTSPSGTGFHPLSMPAMIPGRINGAGLTAYRTVDGIGHYAIPQSGGGSTPVVYLASSQVSSSSVRNVFVPGVRCRAPCPVITRAVKFPDDDQTAAAICELTGTQYTVTRIGGTNDPATCVMLDTSASPGSWRINDLAVMPR